MCLARIHPAAGRTAVAGHIQAYDSLHPPAGQDRINKKDGKKPCTCPSTWRGKQNPGLI